jgi:hypothetical protein
MVDDSTIRRPCDYCLGEGSVECAICSGKGHNCCKACGGKGKI